MAFNIRMRLPEMEVLSNDFSTRQQQGKLDRDEEKFFKKLVKSLGYLAENPRPNRLASHETEGLTRKYGFKIIQSCLENHTPVSRADVLGLRPGQGTGCRREEKKSTGSNQRRNLAQISSHEWQCVRAMWSW